MSSEGIVVEDEQWKKVQDARGPWVALKSRMTDGWPKWVRELDVELKAWLHGEKIVYAEFGGYLDGKVYAGNALEADGLWAVIFSERYVAQVRVDKTPDSPDVESPDVTVVGRSSIDSLSLEVVGEAGGLQGPPIVTRVSFEDLGEIQIPADRDAWFLVDAEVRLRLFAGLRDDIWAQES